MLKSRFDDVHTTKKYQKYKRLIHIGTFFIKNRIEIEYSVTWCLIVDGPVSRVARTVDLPIYDSADCSTVVNMDYGLCAGYFNENKGVCSVSFVSSPP